MWPHVTGETPVPPPCEPLIIMQPDLTVIIISWNTANLLRACLRSVLTQSNKLSLQVIVVDNASSDGSADMVNRAFPQVALIRNATNVGFAVANNQAMRQARGRYVLLLNSDTVVLGDALQTACDYMDKNPDVGVLGTRVLNTDKTVQLTCFADPSLLNMALLALGLHRLPWPRFLGRDRMRHWRRDCERDVDVVTGCFFMIRPAMMQQVGLFDEQFFFYGEETDWCMRIRSAGWRVRFAPLGEVIHHGGASAGMLHERKGLLLADGLVRVHAKHHGTASAACAWLLLLLGNALRAIVFGLRGMLPKQYESRRSAIRFAQIVRGLIGVKRSGASPLAKLGAGSGRRAHEVSSLSRRYEVRPQRALAARSVSKTDLERRVSMRTGPTRILAVASGGGHWVQLLRLRPAFSGCEVTYVTVNRDAADDVGDCRLHVVNDATRWNKLGLLRMAIRILWIILRERPHVVVSTGAAPGYFAVMFGRMLGARTLWLDSLANTEGLSMCGGRAGRHCDLWLTQWPHLASAGGPQYRGAVL